jgi:hypothetical protein
MTIAPSVGVSKYLKVSDGALVESTAAVSTSSGAGAGEHCGGNMTTAKQCIAGYTCTPVAGSHLPFGDVGGTCVKNK